MSEAQQTCDPKPINGRPIRWLLAGIGVVFVGVAAVGVFVPGLPTTVFLIAAAWCFTKSCPYLERVLVRNRLFGPFLKYVDRAEPIPPRAKAIALSMMWAFSALAVALFVLADHTPAWIAIPVVVAACIGTLAIVRWDAGIRRTTAPAA